MTDVFKRVGMLTPSSNTVLEPYTSAIFATLGGDATVHFGRFRVVEISMSETSQSQFTLTPILESAERLAEARVGCMAWNGTSASWLGLDKDRDLCGRIAETTGCQATSTVLAYEGYFKRKGIRKLGLVTPYLSEIQDRIIQNYAQQGITVVADRRLEDRGNFSFSEFSPERVAQMVRDVAAAKPEAISILCTNFRGAPVAAELERELGIPVIDSVSITAAQTLKLIGVEPARVIGWGSIFSDF